MTRLISLPGRLNEKGLLVLYRKEFSEGITKGMDIKKAVLRDTHSMYEMATELTQTSGTYLLELIK